MYINTIFSLTAEVTRGALQRTLKKEQEFIVQKPDAEERGLVEQDFTITPESLSNVRKRAVSRVPPFRISGTLRSSRCDVWRPLEGEVIVHESAVPIRSVELQLVRVETVAYAEGTAKEGACVHAQACAFNSDAPPPPQPLRSRTFRSAMATLRATCPSRCTWCSRGCSRARRRARAASASSLR